MSIRFEHLKTGKGVSVIATFHHWWDPYHDTNLSLTNIHNDKGFYVCDDQYSWASPHLEGMRLFEVDCLFKNPLVVLDQFDPYEEIFGDDSPRALYQTFLRNGGFDSIFYTPHPYGRGVRQGKLLKPKSQILALREITNLDIARLEKMRKSQNESWSKIMKL